MLKGYVGLIMKLSSLKAKVGTYYLLVYKIPIYYLHCQLPI
jgi:hypothetical protein